jgi:pSer/pThr/pTyr-binding forkhead associated (FHA) protein
LCGSRERPLWLGENLLGRAPDAVVPLASGKASRRHARLVASETEAVLEDLGSKNGTRLNGERVTRAVALHPGDRIEVGHELLVFCASAMGSTQTDFDV